MTMLNYLETSNDIALPDQLQKQSFPTFLEKRVSSAPVWDNLASFC